MAKPGAYPNQSGRVTRERATGALAVYFFGPPAPSAVAAPAARPGAWPNDSSRITRQRATHGLSDGADALVVYFFGPAEIPAVDEAPVTNQAPMRLAPPLIGTARLRATLKESHERLFKVEVERTNIAPFELEVVGGQLTVALDDKVRRSATIEAIDNTGELTPDLAEDVLSPFTATVRPMYGVLYPDGDVEWTTLATLRPTKLQIVEQDGAVTYKLTCYDRSVRVQRKLRRVLVFDAGTPVEQVIAQLIIALDRTAEFRFGHSGFTVPALTVRKEAVVWDEAQELAHSIGRDLFVARDGVYELVPRVLRAGSDPVWHFEEGEHSDFWDPARAIDSDNIPNVVVVEGNHAGLAAGGVRAEVADMDPTSPTYRHGPYGEVVEEVTSDKVRSIEQATTMAATLLSRTLGPSDEITHEVLPNPTLDVSNTVASTRERIGLVRRRALISKLALPFDVEENMNVTLRRSIVTADDLTTLEAA